jgi:hypothetical protein
MKNENNKYKVFKILEKLKNSLLSLLPEKAIVNIFSSECLVLLIYLHNTQHYRNNH